MNELKTPGNPKKIEVKNETATRKAWAKPSVTEISRFSILSLAPTVSTAEGATFRAKSS